MMKTFVFVVPAILLFTYGVCDGLECYHCYSAKFKNIGSEFVPCDEENPEASNTIVANGPNPRCVYKVLELASNRQQQIWKTYSNAVANPCDPSLNDIPGTKMLKCTHCGTDKCNLNETEPEKEKNNFTFNINANVNLYIRQ